MKLISSVKDDFESLNLNHGKYLLAFSAGPDSVFLLFQLKEYFGASLSSHIALAYINYHDSPYVNKEEEIVHFYSTFFDLPLYQNDIQFDNQGNFEEWARNYRYQIFFTLCRKYDFQGVITAHQKTDVIETFLLQQKRNNLPTYYGLRKINDLYGLKIVRPLLSVTKSFLIHALKEENILFYDDITNKNLHKERNRLRLQLDESELDPYSSKIDNMNQKLASIYDTFQHYPYGMPWSIYDQQASEFQKRFCFYLLDHNLIPVIRREAMGKLMFDFLKNHKAGSFALHENILLYRTDKEFFLSQDVSKINYSLILSENKVYENEYLSLDLSAISKFNLKHLPATLRNFHPGDTIQTNLPTKDVKTFLQKQGVPFYLIPLYPVFLCEDKIQCVPFYKDILNQTIPLKIHDIRGKF